MSETNKGKHQHGQDAKALIEGVLDQAKNAGYITSYEPEVHVGYPGRDQEQFLAPFIIEFTSGEKWAIYSSTSYRKDRIKGNFWDALHFKKLIPRIKMAYLVYPDAIDEEEKQKLKGEANRITSGSEFSTLDGIYSLSAFAAKLKTIGTAGKSLGFISGAEGRAFESRLANALSSQANLRIAKGETEDSIPQDIGLFEEVVNKLGFIPADLSEVFATNDDDIIGRLPTGGLAKTDVLSTFTFSSGLVRQITISCKKTGAKSVSVAQFSADAICDAVDYGNTKLRTLLNKFQVNGTLGAMTPQETADLEAELKPVLRTFCKWVMGGVGGIGNPTTQWANYIMICKDDPDDFEFWTLDDYVDHLLAASTGNFGTPFQWTFASGRRGLDIQLKVKIID